MALIFEELEREWRSSLASDRRAAHRLAEVCAAFGVETLGELEACVVASGPGEADAVLVALVRRAVGGDGLAGRVLLQLLLPGVRVLSRRWWALGDGEERAAAAVSAVWARIRSYPVDRRPCRVAANVLLDAAQELRRLVRDADKVRPDGFVFPDELSVARDTHPAVELVDVLVDAVETGVVTREEAVLIGSSRIGGVSLREIAEVQGVALRTVQFHRQQAEAALAAAAA